MTTDWKLAARSHGVEVSDSQLEAYANTLTAMETQMAALKMDLPYDAEPATVFQPIQKAGKV